MNAAEMREILRKEVVEVTFIKANGDERKMLCTLSPNFLPVRQEDTTADPVKNPVSDTVVTVWDLDADAWRSFKVASVTEFSYGE